MAIVAIAGISVLLAAWGSGTAYQKDRRKRPPRSVHRDLDEER